MVATSQDTKTDAWPIKTDNINAHLVKAEYAGTLRPCRTPHAFARTATLAVVIPASTVTFSGSKYRSWIAAGNGIALPPACRKRFWKQDCSA